MGLSSTLLFASLLAAGADQPLFEKHWNDRKAELSAYALVQPRYGEPREGHAVMVWVLEPFSRSKAVKLDAPGKTPKDVVRVMKLNHLRTFETGVYEYDLMTSVFSPVVFGEAEHLARAPRKVAFSSQEWCGTVFHQLVRQREDDWQSTWFSYFEAEGDGQARVAADPRLVFDDETWWRVREHTAPFAPGTYPFHPSLMTLRISHAEAESGTLTVARSDKPEKITVPAGRFEVVRWDLTMKWGAGGQQRQRRTIWVERAWPRRIIAWEGEVAGFNGKNEPSRERAELTGSIRNTYWQHNHVKDEGLRRELGLP